MKLRPGVLRILRKRYLCSQPQQLKSSPMLESKVQVPNPDYDMDFVCNPANRDVIASNIQHRKGIGNIDRILELARDPKSKVELLEEVAKVPNMTDPRVFTYGDDPKILSEPDNLPEFDFSPKSFLELSKNLSLLRIEGLGPISGHKSYFLLGDLAQMEEALIQYTIRQLLKHGFELISVPDILPTKIIERCGLIVDGARTLVYELDNEYKTDVSLSGTAEMSLAMKLMNSQLSHDKLPRKLAAVSRCFRAEVSNSLDEPGIYRVHQFTKVEMFVCSHQERSSELLEYLLDIQKNLFTNLGLPFRVIDMPSHDLGAPAYRKIDIEGWMPGKKGFGELSSCSNCTDYQSRRLNIKYMTENNELKYVHTLNGTACAVPRMLIAICENFQMKDGHIRVPEKLIEFMNGKTIIEKQKIAQMRDYKYKLRH